MKRIINYLGGIKLELMTKYQYTYFIYPYAIDEKEYKKYLQRLLRN